MAILTAWRFKCFNWTEPVQIQLISGFLSCPSLRLVFLSQHWNLIDLSPPCLELLPTLFHMLSLYRSWIFLLLKSCVSRVSAAGHSEIFTRVITSRNTIQEYIRYITVKGSVSRYLAALGAFFIDVINYSQYCWVVGAVFTSGLMTLFYRQLLTLFLYIVVELTLFVVVVL